MTTTSSAQCAACLLVTCTGSGSVRQCCAASACQAGPKSLHSSPVSGPSNSAGCCLLEYARAVAQNIWASPACLHRPPTMRSAGTPLDALVVINVALQQSLAVLVVQLLHVPILRQQRLYLGQGSSKDVQQQQRSGSIHVAAGFEQHCRLFTMLSSESCRNLAAFRHGKGACHAQDTTWLCSAAAWVT